jgi:antibiotic biosynthesis monooxygenase (ABM) superfamily enzyme
MEKNAMNDSTRPPATAITTNITLRAGMEEPFAAWQSRFTHTATKAAGFLALDIAPAFAGSYDWRIIQRFRSPEALEGWRTSVLRAHLFAELAPMRDPAAAAFDDETVHSLDPLSCVTEVIMTVVEPGKEGVFRAWAETIQANQSTFPGYMGTLVQAPVSDEMQYWTTLVRFSTPAQLDAWLGCPARKQLLEQVEPHIARWKSYRMASPFAGWFPETGKRSPAAWKQSALVLLVLFPVVMLEIKFLSPLLAGRHVAIATFIANAISVSLVSWPLMKIAVLCMGWWLRPSPVRRWRREALGACTMLTLYIIELAIFMLVF